MTLTISTILLTISIVAGGPIPPIKPQLPTPQLTPAPQRKPTTESQVYQPSQREIYAVAARCLGEATFAVYECACSVRNRVNRGSTLTKALAAYFAPDRIPGEQDLASVKRAFSNQDMRNLYYMLGANDTWLPHHREPVLMLNHGELNVRFYEK